MHRSLMRLASAALILAPIAAYAAKPAVPVVTVGAAGMKQLQFDVQPVSGASYYELWFRANGGASWVKRATSLSADPLFRTSVSAHLLDWTNARYRVSACNPEGCSTTASIAVTAYMKDTVGFFKTRAAAAGPFEFGLSSVLSPDGRTLAVLGGETIGPRKLSLTAYVYKKVGDGWQLSARLLPSPVEAATTRAAEGYNVTQRIAINADGTVLAFGVPAEFVLTPNSPEDQGAVYVFRKTGTTWALEQKLTPPDDRAWNYGSSLDLDDAGQTLAFIRKFNDTDAQPHPRVAIYRRGASGWAPWKTLPESTSLAADDVWRFDLSGDGKVLALRTLAGVTVRSGVDLASAQVLAHASVYGATGIATNRDGSVIAAAMPNKRPPAGADWMQNLMAFRRSGASWVTEPAFTYQWKQSTLGWGHSASFGESIAVSDDGRFIAAGDIFNSAAGTGALRTPVTTGVPTPNGAVMVFERKTSSWQVRTMLKPNVQEQYGLFGNTVAFGDGNRSLAVGHLENSSSARDIDGDPTDLSAPGSGAVWLY